MAVITEGELFAHNLFLVHDTELVFTTAVALKCADAASQQRSHNDNDQQDTNPFLQSKFTPFLFVVVPVFPCPVGLSNRKLAQFVEGVKGRMV